MQKSYSNEKTDPENKRLLDLLDDDKYRNINDTGGHGDSLSPLTKAKDIVSDKNNRQHK